MPDKVQPHWDVIADLQEILAEKACCVDLLWITQRISLSAVLPPLITPCVGESQ